MNKKGFTLIELIVAIVVLAGILLIAIPSIMVQIKDKKNEISENALNIIYDAAKQYMDDYDIKSDLEIGESYCVSLDTLVNDNYLANVIIDPTTKREIPLTKYVKVILNPNEEFDNFQLVDSNCNNQ